MFEPSGRQRCDLFESPRLDKQVCRVRDDLDAGLALQLRQSAAIERQGFGVVAADDQESTGRSTVTREFRCPILTKPPERKAKRCPCRMDSPRRVFIL